MATDGTLARAVSVLTKFGGHSRDTARRFLARCTPEESRAIASVRTATDFEEAVERVLDRHERQDLTRGM